MVIPSLKRHIFSVHFAVLLGLLVFVCLPLTWPVNLPIQFWVKQAIDFCLWAGIFYLSMNFLVPKILYKGKSFLFIVVVLASLIFMVVYNHQIENILNLPFLMNKLIKIHQPRINFSNSPVRDFGIIIITLIMFGVSIIISVSKKIQADQRTGQTLEKEKISSELSFLKAQINPHFFFNILHTIYGLTDTNVKTARESIYTLSQMMRYVLYETKNDLISLSKEIDFIEGYINLMQLRLNEKVQIIFDKPEDLKNVDIAPMLFLPFVENAFKHGISSIYPSYVYIGISQTSSTLKIEVRNSIFKEKAENLEESNGIGLNNTRRRLDLIYPGRYNLTVNENTLENEFNVQLKLDVL